jgi:hypothetical protein
MLEEQKAEGMHMHMHMHHKHSASPGSPTGHRAEGEGRERRGSGGVDGVLSGMSARRRQKAARYLAQVSSLL